MQNRMIVMCALGCLLAAGGPLAAIAQNQPPQHAAAAIAEPATQAALSQFAAAGDAAGQEAALQALQVERQADPVGLTRQLALFAKAHRDSRSNAAIGTLLRRLELPPTVRVRGLAPLLDADDADLAGSARDLLATVESRAPGRRPDFSYFGELISEDVAAGKPPLRGLVEHMYAVDPGEALLTMMRAHALREPAELRELLWAERVVQETYWKRQHGFIAPNAVEPAAVAELARLARHEAWWARLYVVNIMQRTPDFRDETIIEMLRGDANAWVRAAAAE